MSLLDLDGERLDIPCECGEKVTETIGRLKTNPDLTCPRCGTILHVDADELTRGIEAFEKSLRALFD